ncbi:glycosyltransferase [Shewanella sp. C32]|uniref:Glycosyltransferase n=1 Tax=Shewanella electrica TaxID=515560 RepID=A0ABT2FKL3_9GAMM|nr:glycosyltransferase [Shewanella electrica]MCH1924616.1 glycosyltransferase [Shewanella electrica]MCS4556517.1 glycosyltransferase [Shewanella electrica]
MNGIKNVGVVIPTYNAGENFNLLLESLYKQDDIDIKLLVIDSQSDDGTVGKTANYPDIEVLGISKSDFNHGGTRNIGLNFFKERGFDIVVFLTQDVILQGNKSLFNLVNALNDHSVCAVSGRQVPHIDANPLASHARIFNYPEFSCCNTYLDHTAKGLKVAFISNSYAAYRIDVLTRLGGFPSNTILAEDMFVAAKALLANYKVAYQADAVVQHSHNYSPIQEFKRYFDIGVFHACEPWIQEKLGGAHGEGAKFVKSELAYLWRHSPSWIPYAFVTTFCKFLGYKFGLNYKHIPTALRPKFGMYKSYWNQQ